MNIKNITDITSKPFIETRPFKKTDNQGVNFQDFLKNALDEANNLQIKADNYNKLLATGDIDNFHDVMIASEKASLALQYTISVRNKIVDAYKEITRMQI